MRRVHREAHLVGRIGWLRAAVLGANDGIISTASLILGVAAAGTTKSNILLAGVAGLVAGAMSMAAGEHVSVSSQSDTEQADLAPEKREILEDPEAETEELTQIYVKRGVERDVARKVARQLMSKDALGAHAETSLVCQRSPRPGRCRPPTSAASFSIGAAAPLALVLLSPSNLLIPVVSAGSLVLLALLGLLGARTGGAAVFKPIIRVTFWGALAMAVTAGIGALVGTVV